jgi:hypothetical protein
MHSLLVQLAKLRLLARRARQPLMPLTLLLVVQLERPLQRRQQRRHLLLLPPPMPLQVIAFNVSLLYSFSRQLLLTSH